MKDLVKYLSITLIMSILSVAYTRAIDNTYVMEIGVQGGINYYSGDANPHIFCYPLEVAGGQLRYKFDRRWSLSGHANWSRFAYKMPSAITSPSTTPTDPSTGEGGTTGGGTIGGGGFRPRQAAPANTDDKLYVRPLVFGDIVAEFNFFEYGNDWSMGRIKPYTPYLFLGVGVGWYGTDWDSTLGIPASLYFPFGIGFRWKFAPRWGLNVAWQNNLYFKDNLENQAELNNTDHLNGSNILNCDLTGQLTIGIVFDFVKSRKPCTTCSFFN